MQISSIQKIILCHKIARVQLTHMDDEAFCGRFFRGSILPVGEHCEPTGKIEPRKNLPQNPHHPCVCYWALLIYAKYFAKYLKFRKRANLKLEEVSSLSISYNITGS